VPALVGASVGVILFSLLFILEVLK